MLRYAFKKEKVAKSYGRDLPISTKFSVEICAWLRGRSLVSAKKLLERVIEKVQPVPMKRFNRDTAHKTGIAAGRYPVSAATQILMVLKSAEANAVNMGMDVKDLYVDHISADKASRPWHYGRQRRRKAKRTHVQVALAQKKTEKPKKAEETKK